VGAKTASAAAALLTDRTRRRRLKKLVAHDYRGPGRHIPGDDGRRKDAGRNVAYDVNAKQSRRQLM